VEGGLRLLLGHSVDKAGGMSEPQRP